MSATRKRLNVLHVATINKPIMSEIGYGPIETVIYNIDKGLCILGHRSIVACSSDSAVTGQKYGTVLRSLGDYLREDTREGRTSVDQHLSWPWPGPREVTSTSSTCTNGSSTSVMAGSTLACRS